MIERLMVGTMNQIYVLSDGDNYTLTTNHYHHYRGWFSKLSKNGP